MNGWSPESVILDSTGVTATDSADNDKVVSREFGLSAGGATKGWRLDYQVTDVTNIDGMRLQVQQRVVDEWQDLPGGNNQSYSDFTADVAFTIKQSVGVGSLAANFPFAKQFRVVAKNLADGETFTLSKLELSQER